MNIAKNGLYLLMSPRQKSSYSQEVKYENTQVSTSVMMK